MKYTILEVNIIYVYRYSYVGVVVVYYWCNLKKPKHE